MSRVTKMDDSDSCTTMRKYLIPLNCTLKLAKVVNLCHVFYYNKKNWSRRNKRNEVNYANSAVRPQRQIRGKGLLEASENLTCP